MWDLIVSVPDHCLSFYFFFIESVILCHYSLSKLLSAMMDAVARSQQYNKME